MISPDDDEHAFIARWNALIRRLLAQPSLKHIALAAAQYADFHHGTGCHPSNARLARETGYDERTVRQAWKILRALDLAERTARAVPHRGRADEYDLHIPEDWDTLPVLGPDSAAFSCQYCGADINPRVKIMTRTRGVGFDLTEAVFCPPPRTIKGRGGGRQASCRARWDARRSTTHAPTWAQLSSEEAWKLFSLARARRGAIG